MKTVADQALADALVPLVDMLGRLLTVIEHLSRRLDLPELEAIYRRETRRLRSVLLSVVSWRCNRSATIVARTSRLLPRAETSIWGLVIIGRLDTAWPLSRRLDEVIKFFIWVH